MSRWVGTLLLLLSGCQDPLKEAQRLESPRILGVRVAGEGDRASLDPGRTAQLSLLLAGPEGPLAARLAYRFCVAIDSNRGVPSCGAPPFVEGTTDLNGAPIALDVTAGLAPGLRLALLGVACTDGEPALTADPRDWGCSASEPLRLSFDAWTTAAEVSQHHPDLSALSVTLDGARVALEAPELPPSCDDGVIAAAPVTNHRIELELGAGAREAGESLQLSHFSTRGAYERQFSFPDDVSARLDWRAPDPGEAAKHYLVVRDGRGGVSWASFSACAR
jgi:hypothetical protein